MTPEQLRRVGPALYGELWQSALARDLSINGRTMRRWASGETPIPDRVRGDLRALVQTRVAALSNLLAGL